MSTITNSVYIISLPRTGTKTVCKMLGILGYEVKHLPSFGFDRFSKEGYNAFGDTPCYSFSFVKERSFDPDAKFIYIERDTDDWLRSFEEVGLHKGYTLLMNLTMREHLNVARLLDMKSLGEVFGYHREYDSQHFRMKSIEHRWQMEEMLGDRMFVYRLSDGWESLCSYLNLPIPEETIPHLNKKVINEKIA